MNALNSPPVLRLEAQGPGEVSPIRVDRLLEGEVRLPDAAGRVQHFRSGDAFVVPGGFRGEWCNLTPVRKHHAIMLLKEST